MYDTNTLLKIIHITVCCRWEDLDESVEHPPGLGMEEFLPRLNRLADREGASAISDDSDEEVIFAAPPRSIGRPVTRAVSEPPPPPAREDVESIAARVLERRRCDKL